MRSPPPALVAASASTASTASTALAVLTALAAATTPGRAVAQEQDRAPIRDTPAAPDTRCTDGVELVHAFDSGAAWSLCARIDDAHGLELRDVRYRAPGDAERAVLRSLHLGQLLLHRHDAPRPEARIGGDTDATRGLGGASGVALDAAGCTGTLVALADGTVALCARERATGILARRAGRRAVQGESWELFAVARQDLLTWRTGVTLVEDGRIVPSLSLSGRDIGAGSNGAAGSDGGGAGGENTAATLLATWRIEPALDTDAPDRIDELDFPLSELDGRRRPMRTRTLSVEAFRRVERERFRGWRIVDSASGAGYALDPLDSGRSWNHPSHDWARFELAVTRPRDCERHALGNLAGGGGTDGAGSGASEDAGAGCGDGLDDFVDGESLEDVSPVLWFGRSHLWRTRAEDLPLLSSARIEMELAPFDWTDTSPFEALPE